MKQENTPGILVLSAEHSGSSIVAAGYLCHFLGRKARVYCAATNSAMKDVYAIAIMQEDGIDVSEIELQSPSGLGTHKIDYLLVFEEGNSSQEYCLNFEGIQPCYYQVPYPDGSPMLEEEFFRTFESYRNEIKAICKDWIRTSFKQAGH